MIHIRELALGATAFLISHVVEAVLWPSTFAPDSAVHPWFLNSGRAVALTAACLFVIAAIATALARRRRSQRQSATIVALNVAAGAWIAMAVVLAVVGPGTIFPIVMAVAAAVAVFACGAGAFLGSIV